MISRSCESHMEVDVEMLTWNDYLYFNLIYAICAFCLPPQQIPLII